MFSEQIGIPKSNGYYCTWPANIAGLIKDVELYLGAKENNNRNAKKETSLLEEDMESREDEVLLQHKGQPLLDCPTSYFLDLKSRNEIMIPIYKYAEDDIEKIETLGAKLFSSEHIRIEDGKIFIGYDCRSNGFSSKACLAAMKCTGETFKTSFILKDSSDQAVQECKLTINPGGNRLKGLEYGYDCWSKKGAARRRMLLGKSSGRS